MAFTYIPSVPGEFYDNNGDPANGALLFVYAAGTTTKITSYTTSSGTANANPIVLDSAGRATIFLDPIEGTAKFVLEPSVANGGTDPPTSAIWTRDNIAVIPDSTNTDVSGTAAETMNATNVVFLDTSGEWRKADADLLARSGGAAVLAFPVASISSPLTGTFRVAGRVTGLSVSAGTVYYVSTTAGDITSTKPVNSGGVRVVGVADTSTSLLLTPNVPLDNMMWNLANIGFSSGQGSQGDNSETTLSSYSRTIFANQLSEAGHTLVIEGTVTIATTVATKSFAVKVGSASSVTIFSTTDTTSGQIVPFRCLIRYRTSTTAGLLSLAFGEAATAGNPTTYLVNAAITGADWTADQTLAITAKSASTGVNDDVLLTDYNVSLLNGTGTLV